MFGRAETFHLCFERDWKRFHCNFRRKSSHWCGNQQNARKSLNLFIFIILFRCFMRAYTLLPLLYMKSANSKNHYKFFLSYCTSSYSQTVNMYGWSLIYFSFPSSLTSFLFFYFELHIHSIQKCFSWKVSKMLNVEVQLRKAEENGVSSSRTFLSIRLK